MAKITYADKVALNENADVADINKCKYSDMNEIKAVVNANDDVLNSLIDKTIYSMTPDTKSTQLAVRTWVSILNDWSQTTKNLNAGKYLVNVYASMVMDSGSSVITADIAGYVDNNAVGGWCIQSIPVSSVGATTACLSFIIELQNGNHIFDIRSWCNSQIKAVQAHIDILKLN